MTGKNDNKTPKVGTVKTIDGKRMRFIGLDSKGAQNWEGIAPKPKARKVKTQSNTNYKSTRSKAGKPKRTRVRKGK